ncbi:PREDICTED: neurosecretory protein VGF [Thamnophis sirtalis]|uniref:Neurosecretory protein VGF n=1 Tax=Thamnophis sirtalis TaxID=35019 RepID=A0A6I9YML9_9SAUR|nr:PREDICTED: neurosecretory protein VGF [Thamnophis sirtalis]
MLWPQPLRRGTWILLLCLWVQCHRQLAAPLPHGLEGQLGEAPEGSNKEWAEMGPDAGQQKGSREELFQDMDPKALAAVLLQALQIAPQDSKETPLSPKPGANEERVRSEARSSDVQLESLPGWLSDKDRDQPPREEEEAEERILDQPEMENLESMLKELQHYSPIDKREEPSYGHQMPPTQSPQGGPHPNDMLKELEEYQQLKFNIKRKAPPAQEPWTGARKLRQQQHLEHQLLQRRYEELAESRRQAEEARRAAAEEERLADMASDLLLQYLLKDGEEDEDGEGQRGAAAQEDSEEGEGGSKAGSLLFADGEDNVAEDKRSNETPEGVEEEEEDIDPNTIDRLIELSSKLHLPADDVIDIINHVEKKEPEPSLKGKQLLAPPHSKPKKAPPRPSAHQEASHPIGRAFQPYRHLPKQEEAAWNEVLKGNEFPVPKRHQAKDRSAKLSNHINPRTFQTPAYHHYHTLPGPLGPRDGYYDIQAHDEDLENYLEGLLMKHPRGF